MQKLDTPTPSPDKNALLGWNFTTIIKDIKEM